MAILSIRASFLYLWLVTTRSSAQDNRTRYPDDDSFIRASFWKSTAIGDYIYFDGGSVMSNNLYEDADEAQPAYQTRATTLSIDCSTSWSPESVELRRTERPEGRTFFLFHQSLFADVDNDAFYIWGGLSFRQQTGTDLPTLWRFDADGQGGGSWVGETPQNADSITNASYTYGAVHTSTRDGAFAWGGHLDVRGFANPWGNYTSKGLMTFDFETLEWEEQEEDDGYEGNLSQSGSIIGGSATFVPMFGDEGIVVVLGGIESRGPGEDDWVYRDWETVSIYDVASNKWHSQRATGATADDVPSHRYSHCAVGVTGTSDGEPAKTYEIFVYGGGYGKRREEYGAVYALSLPGFRWTKVDDEEGRSRVDHTCASVNGSSLLVSLGGWNYMSIEDSGWGTNVDKDPYPRGIAIFDMAGLEWLDEYDASTRYETNEVIRTWYDEENHLSVEWDSEELEAIFGTKSDSATGDDGESNSPRLTGAIAGVLVGGVASLATIIGLALF